LEGAAWLKKKLTIGEVDRILDGLERRFFAAKRRAEPPGWVGQGTAVSDLTRGEDHRPRMWLPHEALQSVNALGVNAAADQFVRRLRAPG